MIALLMSSLEGRLHVDLFLRLLLAFGVLGGYTTFSSFTYGQTLQATVNVLATVMGCLGGTLEDLPRGT